MAGEGYYNWIEMVRLSASYEKAIASLSALVPELFVAPAGGGNGSVGAGVVGLDAKPRRKFSLDQIRVLSGALGDPHLKFPSVLIAGTNGKGSTAATLASIGRASGLRVGLYTSPHLSRPNERIRVDDEQISDEDFGRLYFEVLDAAEELVAGGKLPGLPSYFELLTALGFAYFAEQKVDLAVLEVGMGGRLDATNLVEPVLSVITDISLDHQEWLGSTIAEITREKAGILRRGGTLVTLPQHPEANQAIGDAAVALEVRGAAATEYMPQLRQDSGASYELLVMGERVVVDSPLKGAHQQRNIALAIAAAVELAGRYSITAKSIEEGIRTTHWPGRLETIWVGRQRFILDVAHNPAGAWALRAALGSLDGVSSGKGLIFACLRDKPLREMTQILFPIFERVVLAPIQSPRATEVAELLAAAEATGVPSVATGSVAEAIGVARALALGTIVVSGSVYLVGEVRGILLSEAGREEQQR